MNPTMLFVKLFGAVILTEFVAWCLRIYAKKKIAEKKLKGQNALLLTLQRYLGSS